jgi:hypothetical protein
VIGNGRAANVAETSRSAAEAYFSDLIGEASGALINAADELAAEAVEA